MIQQREDDFVRQANEVVRRAIIFFESLVSHHTDIPLNGNSLADLGRRYRDAVFLEIFSYTR